MKFFVGSISRDVVKKLVGPFILCFSTIMFLLLLQFLILHIDKLVGKGLPFFIVVDLILSNLAYMVVLAMPMSVLVATLMVFGRISELNEYNALKAAGVSPLALVYPVVAIGLILSLMLVWFSDQVLPEANYRARSLFIDIRLKKPGFDLKENTFYDGVNGYTFLVKKIDNESDSLFDITLFQEETSKLDYTIYKANRGKLKSESDGQTLTLFLHDGTINRFYPKRNDVPIRIEQTEFETYRISFDLSELSFSRSNPSNRSRNDRTLNSASLAVVIDSLEVEKEKSKELFLKRHEPVTKTELFEGKNIINYQTFRPPMLGIQRTTSTHPADTTNPVSSELIGMKIPETATTQYDLLYRSLRDARSESRDYESHSLNIKWKEQRKARYEVEFIKKWAIPMGCLVFVIVGIPLGLLSRKGNLGTAAVIAAIVFTFYWISLIQGEKLADRLIVSPIFGMWFGNGIMAILGVILIIHLRVEGRWSYLFQRRHSQ